MNLKELKELIELVQSSQVVELEIEKSGVRIKIKKGEPAQKPVPSATPPPLVALSQGEGIRETIQPQMPAEAEGKLTITAPVVGTFYRSPSPGTPSYVDVGSPVKKGQVLCVIEAMKLMNEIESESDGRIASILVENAQSVEFGQPLFYIESSTTSS